MFRGTAPLLFALACLGTGCGSDPKSKGEPSEGPPPRSPEEVAGAIGHGDGSPGSVNLVTVLEPVVVTDSREPDAVVTPTGLGFNPSSPNELWISLLDTAPEGECTETADQSGCAALDGAMAIVHDATGASPQTEIAVDGNGWHFMRRPMGMAFGAAGRRQYLSTCGEARTANYTNDEIPYNGPVLWDADRAIFGAVPSREMNGTHVDMLHDTPYCMGVAHEQANVYWVMNGDVGAFDRYDFVSPHEPGGEDHADGKLWRYGEGELLRVPNVPSHMAYDARRGLLYAADSGHGRVVVLDTQSGYADGDVTAYDPIDTHVRVSGASVTELLSPGTLDMPSGIAFVEGVVFVTDRASGRILAMDPAGNILRELDTGRPDSLAGITVGPDGRAYVTDMTTRTVFRIEPID